MSDDPEITDPRDPHKRRDIVAELDEWLEVTSSEPDEQWLAERLMLQRARAEIMTLRAMREAHIRMLSANNDDARDEALEEAAMVADRWEERPEFDRAAAIAAAIRALKDQPKCP